MEKGARSLWIADEKELRQVSFDDPGKIVENTFGRTSNGGFGELLQDVFAEIEKVVPIGRKEGAIGGNAAGQRIETATTVQGWIIDGTVTDADGKPMSGVAVRVISEYAPIEPLANAVTGANGHYMVRFRTNLETLAKSRGSLGRGGCARLARKESRWIN